MKTKIRRAEAVPWRLEITNPDDRKLPKPLGNELITPKFQTDDHDVWRLQETKERGGLFDFPPLLKKRVLKRRKR